VFGCRIRTPPEDEEHSSPERAIVPPPATLLRFAPSPLHVSFSEDDEVEAPVPFDVDNAGHDDEGNGDEEEAAREGEASQPLEVIPDGQASSLSPAAAVALLSAAILTEVIAIEHPTEFMARCMAAVLKAEGGPHHWHVE
jgi:hypothetical protein